MDTKIMEVTPQIAGQWLKQNDGNRKISISHVDRLAGIMARGEWVFNGETIVLNNAMRLLDGQHRLAAIVKTGIPQKMAVVIGIEDDRAFQTFDSVQRARTPDQIAAMMGARSNFNKLVATAKVVRLWHSSKSADDFKTKYISQNYGQALPHEFAADAVSVETAFDEASRIVGHEFAKKSISYSVTIAMTCILNEIDHDTTLRFWETVRSGLFSGLSDPCLHFRDRIMSQSAMKGRGRNMNAEMMAVTIKAWNSFKDRNGMKLLRWSENEKFPTPMGWEWPE